MASNDTTILLDVQARTEKALGELSKVSNEVNNMSKSVFKGVAAWDILKGTLETVGKAMAVVVEVMSEAIAEASESQDAVNQLNQALALNGQYSKQASADMQAFAEKLQATTKFSDDQVVSVLALAQNYGKTTEQSKKLVQAATELSAVTGMDLNSAVEALGATYSGTTGKLAKQIPVLQGLTEAQLKNGAAIEIVLSRYGGAAAAQINTFSGAITQAKNANNGLLETLGEFVVKNPFVIAVIKDFSAFMGALKVILLQNSKAIEGFVTTAAQMTSKLFPAMIRGLAELIRLWAKFSEAVQYAFKTVGWLFLKLGELLGTFKDVVAYTDLVKSIDDATKAYEEQAAAVDDVAKSLEEVVKKNKEVAEQGGGINTAPSNAPGGGTPQKPWQERLADSLGPEGGGLSNLMTQMVQGAQGAVGALQAGASILTNVFLPGFGDAASAIVGLLATGPENVTKTMEDLFKGIETAFVLILDSLDELMIGFTKGMIEAGPKLIIAMIDAIPRFVGEMIAALPEILWTLIDSTVSLIIDLVERIINNLIPGGDGEGILGLGFLGLAKGGTVNGGQVPQGFANDTFPTFLTSGETVIDRGLTDRLDQFLSSNESGNGGMVNIVLQVGQEQLANVLVNLNRQGFRTA